MPTLNWIGKDKVINHHMDVPYRILEHQYGFNNAEQSSTETNSGNKIIHGDNLEALKALLPEYEGQINCIYIDPPYNTGNEGWIYNDNVNDPKIARWLDRVVGKQGEDLSRHDKWLCMMYPRLKLLHKLLAKEGVICISIDDNESSYLRIILDEIFGSSNMMGTFVWRRRVGSSMKASWVSADHEYVIVYSKDPENAYVLGDARDMEKYNILGEDGRKYASMPLTVGMTKEMRPNQWYALIDPRTGSEYWPTEGRVWCYYPPTMKQKIMDNKIIWPDDDPNGRRTTPRLKSYPEDAKRDKKPISTWFEEKKVKSLSKDSHVEFVGKNQEGTKLLKDIFNETKFNYSKPVSLIEVITEQFCKPSGIMLDSFSGSGTTAHALLRINKQDGGKRKFILIEMEDYAENITAERVKRVIKGYGSDKKAVDGTGGSFDYYELGKPLFLDNALLNEEVGLEKIREYVWFAETRKPYAVVNQHEEHLLGAANSSAYYFYYFRDKLTTLDDSFLRNIKTRAEQYVIYADNCVLDNALMQKYHITFKKIPRDITRF